MLDEPTAALDGRTEAQITDTINGLHGRLSVVTVAHRLETVDACDAVYRLVDGQVATVSL